MGRDIESGLQGIFLLSFNPRARMGRDLNHILESIGSDGFNPRARMGRDVNLLGRLLQKEFQPTRPHGARPKLPIFFASSIVSTHAPAWGATTLNQIFKLIKETSI